MHKISYKQNFLIANSFFAYNKHAATENNTYLEQTGGMYPRSHRRTRLVANAMTYRPIRVYKLFI